jgi:serine/threonine protein kinase
MGHGVWPQAYGKDSQLFALLRDVQSDDAHVRALTGYCYIIDSNRRVHYLNMTICCLNPNCQNPQNPDSNNFCFSCGTKLVPVLQGRYRPVEFLGQGGFGRTYRAVDSDRMGASCVIKQFAPQSQGSTFQEAARLFN